MTNTYKKLHIKTVIIQSTWRTLDFAQICSKLNDKIFEKLNIKIIISM